MRKEYVAIKITHLLKERDWTLYRLAKESGVQSSDLKKICFCNRIPTVPTIIKICNGLGITMSEFFNEKSTSIDQLTASERQLLACFHNMAKEDKKLAADYVHSLLKHVPHAADQAPAPENADDPLPGPGNEAAGILT